MFIVIDGPDGCGKTTLAQSLVKELSKKYQAYYTYEPTNDNEFGRNIRNMLKMDEITNIYEFADMFIEDRKLHIKDFIEPHMKCDDIVVCDRYKYSALVYQQLQGVDKHYLIDRNKSCLIPDIVFILNVTNPDVLIKRIEHRGKSKEIFEQKEYLNDVIKLYNKLPEYFPNESFVFLDAMLPIKDNVLNIIDRLSNIY